MPLYHKLALILRNRILSGELREGEYIPTEFQLSEIYSVSRTTVRQAVAELCRQGLLERRQGKGTVVRKQKMQREVPGLSSFYEEIAEAGRKPGTQTLSIETMEPPNDLVASELRLGPCERVVCLTRKRFVDGELLGLSISYFKEQFWNELGAVAEDFNDSSLYVLLESRGHELAWATETIEAVPCDRELAKLLGVPAGLPMLVSGRTVYGRDDQPLEHAYNKFRGDKYQVKLQHKRYKKWSPLDQPHS